MRTSFTQPSYLSLLHFRSSIHIPNPLSWPLCAIVGKTMLLSSTNVGSIPWGINQVFLLVVMWLKGYGLWINGIRISFMQILLSFILRLFFSPLSWGSNFSLLSLSLSFFFFKQIYFPNLFFCISQHHLFLSFPLLFLLVLYRIYSVFFLFRLDTYAIKE